MTNAGRSWWSGEVGERLLDQALPAEYEAVMGEPPPHVSGRRAMIMWLVVGTVITVTLLVGVAAFLIADAGTDCAVAEATCFSR